ncbi:MULTISPECIES: NAD(P)/FAD-dependent oxidoreductase [unclassified Leifsonia]|uniref:NAD(P)/FAD-dependent oxidoreductase n=1 Tax=unclassified Leifsonia TaxID=2663824 RepID=UPI0008A7B358|nr:MULTISPECIES: NAD(P)/FAD-dependent oxidoreductase [unclassified Leifsonia]SEI16895.1 Thioredoxin reductase [Leifsonia sp. CL154]SFM08381.1 Thioredoxin reductase [Leifsonia sp. CL147]
MTDKHEQQNMTATTPPDASDALPEGAIDVAVIGGGAAGLNGALILARSRRSVVVIDSGSPRNAPADAVHGLLALDGTPPSEILRRGREQVRQYGGHVVFGEVVTAEPAAPSTDGDLRFTVTLADGRSITARRILVATGLTDVLPEVPGLAEHWGHSVVHCPYCHGWEVRDEAIGVLATGPVSISHAYLYRQLTEDLTYFTHGTNLDEDNRARFAARGIRIVDTPVTEVVNDAHGALAGVRLADGQVVTRSVIAVLAPMRIRDRGLEGLRLPVQDVPNKGRSFASGAAGITEVPGVWVAGNVTDLTAQVGASAAAGALAGADINRMLAAADADAALHLAGTGETL